MRGLSEASRRRCASTALRQPAPDGTPASTRWLPPRCRSASIWICSREARTIFASSSSTCGKHLPQLLPDFRFPDLGLEFMTRLPVLFVGGRGSRVQMHFDVDLAHVLLCHFGGKKRVMMFAPDQTPYLYRVPFSFSALFAVKPDAPDYDRYPALRHARGEIAELAHGDALYIPPGYWHYVVYDEVGFSLLDDSAAANASAAGYLRLDNIASGGAQRRSLDAQSAWTALARSQRAAGRRADASSARLALARQARRLFRSLVTSNSRSVLKHFSQSSLFRSAPQISSSASRPPVSIRIRIGRSGGSRASRARSHGGSGRGCRRRVGSPPAGSPGPGPSPGAPPARPCADFRRRALVVASDRGDRLRPLRE